MVVTLYQVDTYLRDILFNISPETLLAASTAHMSWNIFLFFFPLQEREPLPNPYADTEVVPLPNDLHHWLYERTK